MSDKQSVIRLRENKKEEKENKAPRRVNYKPKQLTENNSKAIHWHDTNVTEANGSDKPGVRKGRGKRRVRGNRERRVMHNINH